MSRRYRDLAEALGYAIAASGRRLIYGGGKVGLMGVVADAALSNGGEVIGVMPRFLVERELCHQDITSLQIVASMHERKARMNDLSDAFVMLPGGLGTLEEFVEVLTWNQLGLQSKPLGILDADDYFGLLLRFLAHAAAQGFAPTVTPEHVSVSSDPIRLLALLQGAS